jgi:glycosyltransferase involved in cell wall biosynthesis
LKRFLLVIDGLGGGGAEKTMLALAGEMARRGHDVTVTNLRDARAYPIPEGVCLLPCFDTAPRRLRKYGEVRRRAAILDAAVTRLDPWDLVVSTLQVSDRIVRASCLADQAWYRIPNALSVQKLEGVGRAKRLRRRARLQATYRGRKLVAISAGVGRDLTARLEVEPVRLEIIHNPFDIEGIRRLAAEPCPLDGNEYLVSVGRFSPQKRLDRLLGAFGRCGFDGRLVLLGEGTAAQAASLRHRISACGLERRVDLVGFRDNPYPYIRGARALVLASDYEGFGRVLVEALICGTAPVSTRCPHGPEEILTDELATGLADLDETSLAEAIERVLRAPPTIKDEHFRGYAVETIADRYLALAG